MLMTVNFSFHSGVYGLQNVSSISNVHSPAFSSKRRKAISRPSRELPLISPITLYCTGNDFLIQSFNFSFSADRISNIGFLIFIYADKSKPGLFDSLRLGSRVAGYICANGPDAFP